jgi:hypothetical protein
VMSTKHGSLLSWACCGEEPVMGDGQGIEDDPRKGCLDSVAAALPQPDTGLMVGSAD